MIEEQIITEQMFAISGKWMHAWFHYCN